MFSNHKIKFTYKNAGPARRMTGQEGDWYVYANHTEIGLVRKVSGGWCSLDSEDREVIYRTGPRQYIAEELAREAGLLDPEYNDIDPNNWT